MLLLTCSERSGEMMATLGSVKTGDIALIGDREIFITGVVYRHPILSVYGFLNGHEQVIASGMPEETIRVRGDDNQPSVDSTATVINDGVKALPEPKESEVWLKKTNE